MSLAVVRSIGAGLVRSAQELEDFEQELVDQYALAMVGAGCTDHHVAAERATVFEFVRFLGRPVWTTEAVDADRYLTWLRRDRRLARSTLFAKALVLRHFFDFLVARYQGDVHALTGYVVTQPIDEFNRPTKPYFDSPRVPPSDVEVERLFAAWRESLPEARKFLPAARDYLAASLWRRAGLRISETVMLDVRDWRPDLGELGKLHVRFGKGSRGRGPKTRLTPAINAVGELLEWWLADVRHQFGDDWSDPDAPMLPSERRDRDTGRCLRAGADALRSGLAGAVRLWLPAWNGRLTPHALRHYCASSLYARGVDLKAIQELLGHSWLSTTTRYIHVHDGHVEQAWAQANERVAARLTGVEG
ncbi:integrase [Frankia sp. CcI49]|uniref:tyrosine-type recombinase/integrase n=1 Tax=Frankia sp. CcI49 TaxID=1745382 RepID=UPI0009777468|nr:tyrosine-type recombinase/integrase [Frankia sp. CcI49]ONH51366.1 integrase [Frankia sp. CcI49]